LNKESIIELQKLDCNCNDCKFMTRDSERFSKSLEDHHRWQLSYFNTIRQGLYTKSEFWKSKGEDKKAETLIKEADKMVFQFDKKEASINYGHCDKFNKSVSFLPNTIQIDTQECFEHRRN
jgi:hypothetical protein